MARSSTRTRLRPTNRLFALFGGALLLFGVGTNVQAGWVLAVAALLVGVLVVGAVLPIRGLAGIRVERDVPRTTSAGAPMEAVMRITNTSNSTRGFIRISDDFLGQGWAVAGLLAPGRSRTYRSVRTDVRRGVFEVGTCELTTGVPFGVVRTRRTDVVTSPIVVHPKIYDTPLRSVLGSGAMPVAAAVGDVASVRDYRPGDPLRHIHWRSVARHGHLVVREFDDHRDADVVVAAETGDDPEIADAVATIACSIAMDAVRDGDVDLVASTGEVTAHAPDAVLDWGARLGAGDVDVTRTFARRPGAVVFVCPASSERVHDVAQIASQAPIVVVLVGSSDGIEDRLRGAGARVAVVGVSEVERWFANGCVAV